MSPHNRDAEEEEKEGGGIYADPSSKGRLKKFGRVQLEGAS
jgi:hypothetical protein